MAEDGEETLTQRSLDEELSAQATLIPIPPHVEDEADPWEKAEIMRREEWERKRAKPIRTTKSPVKPTETQDPYKGKSREELIRIYGKRRR